MRSSSRTRRASAASIVAVLLATIAATGSGAGAQVDRPAAGTFQREGAEVVELDARGGWVAPTASRRAAADRLDAVVRWNRFGLPATLLPVDGALARGLPGRPAEVARAFLLQHRGLFGLSEVDVGGLELIYDVPLGPGNAVLFRQTFDGLSAGRDGLVALAVRDDRVVFSTSSLAPSGPPSGVVLSDVDAVLAAGSDLGLGISADDILRVDARAGETVVTVDGLTHDVHVSLAAVPVADGVRSAHEVVLIDNEAEPLAVRMLVDATNGSVLVREDLVDHQTEEPPDWQVFPATPPLDYSSTDTREIWCWEPSEPDCDRIVGNSASPFPWDVDATTGLSTTTSIGNNARTVENWLSADPFTVGVTPATPRPDRDYRYPWTNQWFVEACNPATTFPSPQRNDIDAAIANLFVMHNRMHDWSYHLGFTETTFNLQSFNFGLGGAENDPEQGNAQAGGIVGGPPGFLARDNANQITPPDGQPPITNMYLWQPIAAAFYAPCVDGDYDMSVIGHEYTHAISNRMVAGPDEGLTGSNSRAMGESWSDLAAMEILNEYGFVPVAGENRYAVGPYVTGDPQAGIRNYGMNQSPLNFSDVGYDFVCNSATCPLLTQVHADGEIWSAVNFDIRQAMNARYDGSFPSSDVVLQQSCAEGLTPVDQCPGNRRWIQLVFDAWLLMATGTPTMIDARDAMLASDLVRFGGANQDLLWNAFARRGFGETASQGSSEDADPIPSFASPFVTETAVSFRPLNENAAPIVGELFVGRYEARVTPVADTDPATALGNTVAMVPGTYEFLIRADGYGMRRLTFTVPTRRSASISMRMSPNLASIANGAIATGDGTNLTHLIDDTEGTNWAYLGALDSGVAGRQVTVHLDPSRASWQISRIRVSALLRTRVPADPGGDVLAQNRFSALRSFELWTCRVQPGVDCTQDAHYQLVLTSPADAFPAVAPRPRAPDLLLREFAIPRTRATYVRLVVLTNQCTGAPDYQGEQDADPGAVSDCGGGSTQDDNVRAAELQVFQK